MTPSLPLPPASAASVPVAAPAPNPGSTLANVERKLEDAKKKETKRWL